MEERVGWIKKWGQEGEKDKIVIDSTYRGNKKVLLSLVGHNWVGELKNIKLEKGSWKTFPFREQIP